MGEEVKVVVELVAGVTPTTALENEFIQFAGQRIARYMLPKSIDFTDSLPRLPTGKLYKKALRDRYWNGQGPIAKVRG